MNRSLLGVLPFMFFPSLAQGQALPPTPEPLENPVTPEKAVLGKILFWDEQASTDGTVACGTCHVFSEGGSDSRVGVLPGADGLYDTADDVFGSPGVINMNSQRDYAPHPVTGLRPRISPRQALTIVGAGFFSTVTWNGGGRDPFVDPGTGQIEILTGGALESSAVVTPLLDFEMAHAGKTWDDLIAKLEIIDPLRTASNWPADVAAAIAGSPSYPDLFQTAFGSPEITSKRYAFAISSYVRTLRSDETPWDRFEAGDTSALTPDQQAGLALFEGAASCSQCHPAPLFSDDAFHNTGIRSHIDEPGAFAITGDLADQGAFKTPTLRNAGLRSRFMHAGDFATLEDVIEFYDVGGGPFTFNLDPLMAPLGLTAVEKAQLVDFVRFALTDPRVEAEVFPFDRPTLFSEQGIPDLFGSGLAGSGGFVPRMIAISPFSINNPDFRLAVADGLGGALAVMAVSRAVGPPGQNYQGTPIHIGLGPPLLVTEVVLSGSGPGAGHATVHAPTPTDVSLIGGMFACQWFVIDPGSPTGLPASRAVFDQLF